MNIRTCIILLLFLWILVGCKFDYSKAALEENLNENVPNIILEDATLVFVRGTEVSIQAKKIDIYSSRKQQDMLDITFTEVTSNGEMRMQGRADQITIETESNNITMTGNIFARSYRDEAEIETNYLYWNDENRIIRGSTVSPVTITKDIGSKISGIGFKGDAEKRELIINGETKGELVVDE